MLVLIREIDEPYICSLYEQMSFIESEVNRKMEPTINSLCSPHPWRVDKNHKSLPKAIHDSKGNVVCTFPQNIHSNDVVRMQRMKADAFLIASAPQLLIELTKAKELRQQALDTLEWIKELPIDERDRLETIIEWDAPIGPLTQAINDTEGINAVITKALKHGVFTGDGNEKSNNKT